MLLIHHFRRAARFFFAAFAPSLPSAVRVALGRCAAVLFFFAIAAAFLMFFLAEGLCAAVIRKDRIAHSNCAFPVAQTFASHPTILPRSGRKGRQIYM